MKDPELSADTIKEGLLTHIIGQNILWFASTTSTNDIARQAAQNNAVEGTAVIANEQTAGKGRLNRNWTSPRGTIAISIILRPDTSRVNQLIMIASVGVTRAVERVTGLKPHIKWPNDVQITGKKICGILIENGWHSKRLDYAVIGIGINVNFDPFDYPDIAGTATSLSRETGHEVSRLAIVRNLLIEFDNLYTSDSDIFKEWRNNLVTLGQQIRVTSGSTIYEGIAEDVERDGSLILRTNNNNLVIIPAGDVTLRK